MIFILLYDIEVSKFDILNDDFGSGSNQDVVNLLNRLDSFKYLHPEVSEAYLTIARNIANAPRSSRVQGFNESEYLKTKLDSVADKSKKGRLTADDPELLELIKEFDKVNVLEVKITETSNIALNRNLEISGVYTLFGELKLNNIVKNSNNLKAKQSIVLKEEDNPDESVRQDVIDDMCNKISKVIDDAKLKENKINIL